LEPVVRLLTADWPSTITSRALLSRVHFIPSLKSWDESNAAD
jgi:hypothetical protein